MKNALFVLAFVSSLFAPNVSAQSISIASGNGQVVREQFLSVPLVVQLRDAAGNPAPGVAVSWTLTQGSGTLVAPGILTDAKGQASVIFLGTTIQPGTSFVPNSVRADTALGRITFQVTTSLSQGFALLPLVERIKPTSNVLTGPAGAVLPAAVQVQVTAQSGTQSGQPVPNVALRIVDSENPGGAAAASCNAAVGTVLTDGNGRASCDLRITGAPGSYVLTALVGEYQYTQPFALNITDAPVCSFNVTLSNTAFASNASSGTYNLTAAAACGWTATSNDSWITLSPAASGAGNGSGAFNVAANPGAARTGSIRVADKTVTITQSAVGSGPTTLAIQTQAGLPSATRGSFYSANLSASGGQTPYIWAIGGGLPPGLTLTAASGAISGVPTTTGSFAFNASVTDAAGNTKSQAFTLNVTTESAGLAITNTSFPNAVVGAAYEQILASSGAVQSPFSQNPAFTVTSGALPAGLSIRQSAAGIYSISGTPTTAGTSNFRLTVTDAAGRQASVNFNLTVTGPASSNSLVISPTSLLFNIQQNGPIPAPQGVSITGANSAQLNYTATPSASLLSLTQSAGTTPASLLVGLSTTALAPGTYNASVAITSPGVPGAMTVGVVVNVVPGTALAVSPSSLVFREAIPQTLTVTAGGSVHFTVSTFSANGWLSVTPLAGDTPSSVSVNVNPTGLAPGAYNGAITLLPTGGVAVTVPVNFIVQPPATADANPKNLAFTYQSGSTAVPAAQPLTVLSIGGATNFTAIADQPWLLVGPASGTTPATLSVSIAPGGLAPGNYTGRIQFSPGSIISVGLTVTAPEMALAAVTNAASFAVGPVAPGEFVTLFGKNIGPPAPAGLRLTAGGTIDTQVSDTRVLFDGVPAPLVYVSQTQVSAIVPYDVYQKSGTRVQVEYKGVRSNAVDLQVSGASPAIFPGAILNGDLTPNSPGNAAQPGSIIVLYATGEGQTDPAGANGRITGDVLAKPLLAVGVEIGGRAAEVLYAGSAPTLPAGVMQVNVRIPDGVRRGADVPVVLTVGDARSPAGAVVAIVP